MDNNKVRLNITIDQSTKEYIDKVKKEKNLRSQSQAIDYIIMQERENDNVDKIKDRYENMFTRIRLGATTADRNSQVMIEILNSMIYALNITQCYNTDYLKTDVVRESQDIIKNRIEYYKQIKDSKLKNNTKSDNKK